MAASSHSHAAGSERRLVAGLIVSLLVHIVAGVVLVALPRVSSAGPRAASRPVAPQDQPEAQIQLGQPDSSATSITWIGYDEFKQQYATRESEIDQAQFTPDPTVMTSARMPVPTNSPEQVEAQQARAQEEASAEHPADSLADARPTDASAQSADNSVADALDRAAAAVEQLDTALADLPAGPPAENAQSTGKADESSQAQAAQAAAPPASSPPSARSGDPGDQSDRESDAASRLVAREAQLGKPLSGKGLEILTVRPRFTHYTTLTARPRNPLIRIEFAPDGRVSDARFLLSTGVRDVDRPLLDAVFKWRARGPQLKRLSEGIDDKTLAIELRIILR